MSVLLDLEKAIIKKLNDTASEGYAEHVEFSGGGLDDMTVASPYTTPDSLAIFEVQIKDTTSSPDYDLIQWRKNGGNWSPNIPLTPTPVPAAIALSDGVEIQFAASKGHTFETLWTITVTRVEMKAVDAVDFRTDTPDDTEQLVAAIQSRVPGMFLSGSDETEIPDEEKPANAIQIVLRAFFKLAVAFNSSRPTEARRMDQAIFDSVNAALTRQPFPAQSSGYVFHPGVMIGSSRFRTSSLMIRIYEFSVLCWGPCEPLGG